MIRFWSLHVSVFDWVIYYGHIRRQVIHLAADLRTKVVLLSPFRGISFDSIPLGAFPGPLLALISSSSADQSHIQDPNGALGSLGDAYLLVSSMIVVNIVEEVQV